jgi:VCPO second helical-bundle domain
MALKKSGALAAVFSGVASRVFSNFVGTDAFKVPLTVTVPAGSSTIEPGLVPARATVLTFKSFTDAADQAGLSRRYGGIHFTDGDLNGRALGAKIGDAVWAKAQRYFSGTAG